MPDTKPFRVDLRHKTLIQAIADGVWDVITIGFNLLNQSARETVLLPATVDVDAELARLDRVVEPHGGSLPDLAYRFVREAAGISSVLVGTGNPDHLRADVATFEGPRLDVAVLEELSAMMIGVAALNSEPVEPHRRSRTASCAWSVGRWANCNQWLRGDSCGTKGSEATNPPNPLAQLATGRGATLGR